MVSCVLGIDMLAFQTRLLLTPNKPCLLIKEALFWIQKKPCLKTACIAVRQLIVTQFFIGAKRTARLVVCRCKWHIGVEYVFYLCFEKRTELFGVLFYVINAFYADSEHWVVVAFQGVFDEYKCRTYWQITAVPFW